LRLLWRVYSSNANAVLLLVWGEDGERVTVSDVDYLAGEFVGVGEVGAEQQGEQVAHDP